MAGDGDEGLKVRGKELAKVEGVHGALGGRNQTSLGINKQETGDGSGVGGPTANIKGLCKEYGIRGRGEVYQDVVLTGGFRTTDEGHVKRDFSSSVG